MLFRYKTVMKTVDRMLDNIIIVTIKRDVNNIYVWLLLSRKQNAKYESNCQDVNFFWSRYFDFNFMWRFIVTKTKTKKIKKLKNENLTFNWN